MKLLAATVTALLLMVTHLTAYADPDNRQDRREERGRSDERQDRRDCRQEEGMVGKDKRECKREEVRDGPMGHRDERKDKRQGDDQVEVTVPDAD